MTFTLQQTLSDVLAWLGIPSQPDVSESSPLSPSDTDIIRDKIRVMLPSMGSMIAEADASEISDGIQVSPDISLEKMPCGLHAAIIPLDQDTIRICTVKMRGWSRPAPSVMALDSPACARLLSRETGIAGSPANPKAYITAGIDGPVLAAMGSESASDTLESLKVWKIPSVAPDGRFSFPARLYPRLVAHLAERISAEEGDV